MLDLSNLAPIIAAAIIGGLFAFHNAPVVAEEGEQAAKLRAQASKVTASRFPHCPADMDFNYANVDRPRALNKTYLP